VDATELGKLLHETHVPLLILNACRSADSEPPERPGKVGDLHEQVRQLGSFAHAVMDCGASGVVAWRYSVFVDTAAHYMADLYASLASGSSLGESATFARKQLSSSGGRSIDDWTVPVVFEAAAVRLFPRAGEEFQVNFRAHAPAESGVPPAPDIGFIGRDETILKLDRTFNEQSIVLLHGYAGSGKTSAVAEFARWYGQTGNLSGPVLFISFEQHKTLPRVLDELGRAFESGLSKGGIQWLTLDDEQRRDVALQVLRQIPVLWVWDNVEPIGGFPTGTPSAWNASEQEGLADFLRAGRGTKAKFLLTSRRDERDWLHDLPARIGLPPMPFDERVQMTEELAKKRGRRLDDVEDWRSLLRFTQGNPLTLTVLVGQALREGLRSRDQIEGFVGKLQAGEAVFEDEASEGRTRSLAASLAYGFENAFTEAERKQLALLHLFQGFVQVPALQLMGAEEEEWCLPEVRGITREDGIVLLDRAAEVGLLTELGHASYSIHPALPWFFRRLFEHQHAEQRIAATRAFVEAMGALGNYYNSRYEAGNSEVVIALTAEERNLLRAQALALSNGWSNPLAGAMSGLEELYGHTGPIVEWSRLVMEVVPDFFEPMTGGPIPGKEAAGSQMTQYRVSLARTARCWKEAERLQSASVKQNRQWAAPILAKPPQEWNSKDERSIRILAATLHDLSEVQREQRDASCIAGYNDAIALAELISDFQGAASCTFNLGRAYIELAPIRDLGAAEGCFKRGLAMLSKDDRMGQAKCLGQLGLVAYVQFCETSGANLTPGQRLGHLLRARAHYAQALDMFPASAVGELATTHSQLGIVCSSLGQIDVALDHYLASARLLEGVGDRFEAGKTRYNAAFALAGARLVADAREWVQAALRDFRACENADQEILLTLKLLEQIESDLQATSPPS
jgi:tetratricopeptide (TPR) repeat protein